MMTPLVESFLSRKINTYSKSASQNIVLIFGFEQVVVNYDFNWLCFTIYIGDHAHKKINIV